MKHFYALLHLATILPLTLSACGGGGGGGGGDFVGAGQVQIEADPRKIDPGDRTQVKIQISEVHPDGISLKIRYPDALTYALDSSTLKIDKNSIEVSPFVNARASDGNVYLVYYFSQADFGKGKRGELTLQLEGVSEKKDAALEVDPDVDDPKIPNASEFDLTAPDFNAEDEVTIQVVD